MSLTWIDRRHEVWEENDGGDWQLFYFDVPLPSRFQATDFQERVAISYQESVKKAIEWCKNEGMEPTTKPQLNPNAFFVPEPGMEDHRRFYYAAKLKRTKPLLLPLDTVSMLESVGHVDQVGQIREFFDQMGGIAQHSTAEEVGRVVEEDSKLPQKAEEERKAKQEFEDRLQHRITL